MARAHEGGDPKCQRCLEPDDAARGSCDGAFLFLTAVGSVVCCDDIDRSVGKPGDDRLPILLCAERRVHLGKRAVREDSVLCQCEMMRSRLCMEPGAHGAEHADQLNRASGADVLDHYVST